MQDPTLLTPKRSLYEKNSTDLSLPTSPYRV